MSLGKAQKDVAEFATKILGLPQPPRPVQLTANRFAALVEHLEEELNELKAPDSFDFEIEAGADALVDIIYLALRGLHEMGVDAEAAFNEVHAANMRKERGYLNKRPAAAGFDAIKPIDWAGPNWKKVLSPKDLNAEAVQQTAEELVMSRAELYGSFKERAVLVDKLILALEEHPNYYGKLQSNHRHALRMITEKMGRIIVGGDPGYADNWKDIAGYAELVVKDQ